MLVTGATSGIGMRTALGLARLGANVVMSGRDAGRGQAARDEVCRASGNPLVDLMLADFASLAQVRRLAAEFEERYHRLDVLVNNAGGILPRRQESTDGYEMTWAVNHLAPFLLTNLLLGRLRASAPARVVTVASNAHLIGRIRLKDLQRRRRWSSWGAYGQSKLANILFTTELARRLAGSGVSANCIHPGIVDTNFAHSGGTAELFFRLVRPFLRKADHAAQLVLHLALSPQVDGISGRYFANGKVAWSTPASRDAALARRLWDVSARSVGITG